MAEMSETQEKTRIFDDFDVVDFLEKNNVNYDEWLKSQFLKLVGELQEVAETKHKLEMGKLIDKLKEQGNTAKQIENLQAKIKKLTKERAKPLVNGEYRVSKLMLMAEIHDWKTKLVRIHARWAIDWAECLAFLCQCPECKDFLRKQIVDVEMITKIVISDGR